MGHPAKQDSLETWLSFIGTLITEGKNKTNHAIANAEENSGCCLAPSLVNCFVMDSGAAPAPGADPD